MGSRRSATGLAVAGLLLAACSATPGSIVDPGGTSAPIQEISEHEAGPESRIAYGLTVPAGATQLGPLARYRSSRMITAYAGDLTAKLTQEGIADAVKSAGGNPDGVARPEPPAIIKNGRPDDDSFAVLDDPPGADITAAVIRLDREPTESVTSMVKQIAAILPDAEVDADDFASYCTVVDNRVTGCAFAVTGLTEDDRQLAISFTVDPGDLSTRTAPPSSLTFPVMEIRIEDLSDPRTAKEAKASAELALVEDDEAEPADPGTKVIWPAMDLEAPQDSLLLNGWLKPEGATMLLSSFTANFVALFVPNAADAREIARAYVASLAPGVDVKVDSYEALNEVDITFSATAPDGSLAQGTQIITARGNYVMLFYTPPPAVEPSVEPAAN